MRGSPPLAVYFGLPCSQRKRMGGEAEESAVPAAILESVRETEECMLQVKGHLLQALDMAKPDVLADMPPLQRAGVFLTLAKTATALLAVRFRCNGICPDDHPIKTEFERLNMHEDKLRKYKDWSNAPLRPSTTINYKAATRFIQHSLPDLTQEQKQSMREISRGERVRSRDREFHKKRKYPSEKQSVRDAAKEFLEKAARELLGSNDSGVKGPLQARPSDDEDEPVS